MDKPKLFNEITDEEWAWLGKFIGVEIPMNLTGLEITMKINDAVRYQFNCVAEIPKELVNAPTRESGGWDRMFRKSMDVLDLPEVQCDPATSGESIVHYAERMIELSKKKHAIVNGNFNDIKLGASPITSVDYIAEFYSRELERRRVQTK